MGALHDPFVVQVLEGTGSHGYEQVALRQAGAATLPVPNPDLEEHVVNHLFRYLGRVNVGAREGGKLSVMSVKERLEGANRILRSG